MYEQFLLRQNILKTQGGVFTTKQPMDTWSEDLRQIHQRCSRDCGGVVTAKIILLCGVPVQKGMALIARVMTHDQLRRCSARK
jgi:hypothetical protein